MHLHFSFTFWLQRYFELQQVRRKHLQATATTTTASEQPQAKRQCLYSPYQQNTAYSPYATYQRYSQQIPYQQYQMYQPYYKQERLQHNLITKAIIDDRLCVELLVYFLESFYISFKEYV